jgi:hypothetical protein
MGKMKKTKKTSATNEVYRIPGDPIGPKVALGDDIESLKSVKSKDRNKSKKEQIDEKVKFKLKNFLKQQHLIFKLVY